MNYLDLFSEVTDLGISERTPENSLLFPGPISVNQIEQGGQMLEYISGVLQLCKSITDDEFTIQFEGLFWRGHWDNRVVDGRWIRLRKQPSVAPAIDTLPIPLPKPIQDLLLNQQITSGMVLIVGSTGSGKTTTASATVVSRLKKLGGISYTVEDPPELPLNGWHGEGYCTQTRVNQSAEGDPWAAALKGALRSQPAKTPAILFVGEIRTPEAAKVALQAASNGFLVIATAFATDIVAGVEAYAKHVGPENYSLLADLLRIVVFQNLTGDILKVNVLVNREGSSVSGYIRKGAFTSLMDEFTLQKNLLMQGTNLLAPEMQRAA